MVRMTESLQHWLWDNGYRQEMVLIGFGHLECFTEEMQKEYLKWLQTEYQECVPSDDEIKAMRKAGYRVKMKGDNEYDRRKE